MEKNLQKNTYLFAVYLKLINIVNQLYFIKKIF